MITPSFTIITVVHNGKQHIQETFKSVVDQSYKNFEYIIIDGKSSDGTAILVYDLISSCATITHKDTKEDCLYLEAIHKFFPTITFKFLYEKDNGVYDAMNKGVLLATKEWINFMNCGDFFFNSNVLQQVANENLETYDIVYGDTRIFNKAHSYILQSSRTFRYRMPFCHQSSFTRASLLALFPFDTSYKICADNDLFTKLYSLKYKFKKVNFPISIYSLDGISASPSWRMFFEECKISYKYNKIFPIYLSLKWILWTVPKQKFKKLIFR